MTSKHLEMTQVMLSTSRHHIKCMVEVLSGQITPHILISQDLLAKYGFQSFENSIINPPGMTPNLEPSDLSDDDTINDSEHQAYFLEELRSDLEENETIDQAQPCPLPEALITIMMTMDKSIFHQQPLLNEKASKTIDKQLIEPLKLGFVKPTPVRTKYNSMIFLVPKKDIVGTNPNLIIKSLNSYFIDKSIEKVNHI